LIVKDALVIVEIPHPGEVAVSAAVDTHCIGGSLRNRVFELGAGSNRLHEDRSKSILIGVEDSEDGEVFAKTVVAAFIFGAPGGSPSKVIQIPLPEYVRRFIRFRVEAPADVIVSRERLYFSATI
jgi:hypothetical protein